MQNPKSIIALIREYITNAKVAIISLVSLKKC